MFPLFKRKECYEEQAGALYRAAMNQSRKSYFYDELGVPDTIDGRFDMLLLHLFVILNRLKQLDEKDLSQALFDFCFADMEQALRQQGIGDMGIPKRIKPMMLAFNGRMHAYSTALDGGGLDSALHKNIYGGAENISPEPLKKYVEETIVMLEKQKITDGVIEFKDV